MLTGSNYVVGKGLNMNCSQMSAMKLSTLAIHSNDCVDTSCHTFTGSDGYYLQLQNGVCIEISGDSDTITLLPGNTGMENGNCNTR